MNNFLNNPWKWTECPINIIQLFPACIPHGSTITITPSLKILPVWLSVDRLVFINQEESSVPFYVDVRFSRHSLNVPWICPECSLNVPRMFPECTLNVPWMYPECSMNVLWMFFECA
jgi:hypothetical protein